MGAPARRVDRPKRVQRRQVETMDERHQTSTHGQWSQVVSAAYRGFRRAAAQSLFPNGSPFREERLIVHLQETSGDSGRPDAAIGGRAVVFDDFVLVDQVPLVDDPTY